MENKNFPLKHFLILLLLIFLAWGPMLKGYYGYKTASIVTFSILLGGAAGELIKKFLSGRFHLHK